jgi:hypothetical protein
MTKEHEAEGEKGEEKEELRPQIILKLYNQVPEI